MKYEKQIILKNGQPCLLRHPTAEDAQKILDHMILTSAETDNMARYADEFTMTAAQEALYLTEVEESEDAVMVSAELDGEIVANSGFNPVAKLERCRHRAELGISIRQDCWGLGIGTAVMQALIDTARQAGYEQLELDVVETNQRAIALYEKMGFVSYGLRENSFKYRDGHSAALRLMLLRL